MNAKQFFLKNKRYIAGCICLIFALIGFIVFIQNPIDDPNTGNQASGNLIVAIVFGTLSLLCFIQTKKLIRAIKQMYSKIKSRLKKSQPSQPLKRKNPLTSISLKTVSKKEQVLHQGDHTALFKTHIVQPKKSVGKKRIVTVALLGLAVLYCIIVFSVNGMGGHPELKAELQAIINTQIESEDAYTPNSYNNYLSALADAKATKDKSIVTAKQLQTAKSNLESALAELSVKPDKTELSQKLENARQLNREIYVPKSIAALIKGIDESAIVLEDENAIDVDVQRAITNLDAVINALIIKPDKTGLENLLSQAKKLDKNLYTTASEKQLDQAISSATETANNENAAQSQVDKAQQTLKESLDSMVKATNGVYTINCSLKCLATNHVGSDWSSTITYNGQGLRNGDTITAPLNGSITIKGEARENDNAPDYGSGSVTISLSGEENSTRFYVRENRGHYSGNSAVWELTCSATLVERI